jgi:23S rRNA pseudouridine2605 synthase
MEERVQKILSRAGIASRRACEELIAHGRVTVNGKVISLGDKADPKKDQIALDGKPITLPEELIYIAVHKPRNVISATSSPDRRQTVRDLVPVPGHLYPVGRLDVDSEGLILLTNDGELANQLTHPKFGHEKEYKVLVARHPDQEQLSAWRRGVVLDEGYKTAPADVYVETLSGKGAWLRITLREGRKRQIRATGSQLGLPVVTIIRVRIGSLLLGSLMPGEWRHLKPAEIRSLKTPQKPLPRQKPGPFKTDPSQRTPASRTHSSKSSSRRTPPDRPSSTKTPSSRTPSKRPYSPGSPSTRTPSSSTPSQRHPVRKPNTRRPRRLSE